LSIGKHVGHDVSRRYKNVTDIAGYVRMMDEQGHAEAESEIIEGETLMLEMILMQLRLNEGLSVSAFRRRTGHDPRVVFGEALGRFCNSGFLTVSDERIALARAGFLQANYVIGELAAAIQKPAEISS
jgi:oxygen-independent coproporphyrinogen-3 oxidase